MYFGDYNEETKFDDEYKKLTRSIKKQWRKERIAEKFDGFSTVLAIVLMVIGFAALVVAATVMTIQMMH